MTACKREDKDETSTTFDFKYFGMAINMQFLGLPVSFSLLAGLKYVVIR